MQHLKNIMTATNLHRSLLFISGTVLLLMFSCKENSKNKEADDQTPQTDFCAQIHASSTTSLKTQLDPFQDKMRDQTGVYVLEAGEASLISRAWLCEYAEKTIDVQYFIFSTDNVGLIACDYLVRAAERGVKVRILVDDIMVDAGPSELLTMQSNPNISVKIYNPNINTGKSLMKKLINTVTDFHGINQRMHNKAVIVDGNLVITGGRNMEDAYFDFDHRYNYRDRDVLLLGGMTSQIQNSFDQFWGDSLCVDVEKVVKPPKADSSDVYARKLNALHQYACNPENFWPEMRERIKQVPVLFEQLQQSGQIQWLPNDSVRYVSDDPGKNEGSFSGGGKSTSELIRLVRSAKDSIIMQTPYLVTTDLSRNLFKEMTAKGIKIKILTNSLASTDALEAFNGYQRDRAKLLATGVEIYEFKPDAAVRMKLITGDFQKKMEYAPIFGLHAKSMVIDGKTSVIGTFNLDPRSANLNTECITIIDSKEISKGVLEGMMEEFLPENAWKITPTFNPDSVVGTRKNIEAMSRRIVPKKIL